MLERKRICCGNSDSRFSLLFSLSLRVQMRFLFSSGTVPFLKIGVSKDRSQLRQFKEKKDHIVIDTRSANVVELFIVGADFDPEKFMREWEMFDLVYTVAPMEYFVNGKLSKGFLRPKYEAIYSGNESLFGFKTRINDQIGIMAAWYPDDNIDGSKQSSFISFYENQNYLRFMACAPVE